MSSDLNLPSWVRLREVLEDDRVEWRGNKRLNYLMTNIGRE